MATRSVPQPPFSAELLADLHADNIDPDLAARLWPVVRADPDAAAYLRGLDQVTARVRALGGDRIVHRMPDEVADRLATFLDGLNAVDGSSAVDGAARAEPIERLTEVARTHMLGNGRTGSVAGLRAHVDDGSANADEPVEGLTAPTPLHPRKRPPGTTAMRWAAAAAAVVAVLGGAGIGLWMLDTGADSPPVAQPTSTTEVGGDLDAGAALAALGRHDVSGPLGDAAALENCVRAAGLDRPVLGSMSLTYRNSEAVLILVAGPQPPKITALVVGPGCGADNPDVLDITDIG